MDNWGPAWCEGHRLGSDGVHTRSAPRQCVTGMSSGRSEPLLHP